MKTNAAIKVHQATGLRWQVRFNILPHTETKPTKWVDVVRLPTKPNMNHIMRARLGKTFYTQLFDLCDRA